MEGLTSEALAALFGPLLVVDFIVSSSSFVFVAVKLTLPLNLKFKAEQLKYEVLSLGLPVKPPKHLFQTSSNISKYNKTEF